MLPVIVPLPTTSAFVPPDPAPLQCELVVPDRTIRANCISDNACIYPRSRPCILFSCSINCINALSYSESLVTKIYSEGLLLLQIPSVPATSLIVTTKANNLNTYKYLEMLLTFIPIHMNDTNLNFMEALLPRASVVQQECMSKN